MKSAPICEVIASRKGDDDMTVIIPKGGVSNTDAATSNTVIASAAKQSRISSAETVWIASLRSQ